MLFYGLFSCTARRASYGTLPGTQANSACYFMDYSPVLHGEHHMGPSLVHRQTVHVILWIIRLCCTESIIWGPPWYTGKQFMLFYGLFACAARRASYGALPGTQANSSCYFMDYSPVLHGEPHMGPSLVHRQT